MFSRQKWAALYTADLGC